jgi:uncharacterized damage-inducible protein DinB
MPIAQSLLPEFDHEAANTRKILAAIPDGHAEFAPHPKSMPLGRLAVHVAHLPSWGADTLTKPSFDVNPQDAPRFELPPFETTAKLLEDFDRSVAEARAAIEASSDADLMVDWSLLNAGAPIFTMPRVAVLRSMILNHMIHHRAQLGVYLRLLDVPVPGIYGPSADDIAAAQAAAAQAAAAEAVA